MDGQKKDQFKRKIAEGSQKLLEYPREQLAAFYYEEIARNMLVASLGMPAVLAGRLFHLAERNDPSTDEDTRKAATAQRNCWVVAILAAASHVMREIDPQVAARLSAEAEMRLLEDVQNASTVDA